jgi:hypothetical protein
MTIFFSNIMVARSWANVIIHSQAVPHVRGWVTDRLKNTPLVLNIAGPREQKAPGIYEQAMGFLRDVVITEA